MEQISFPDTEGKQKDWSLTYCSNDEADPNNLLSAKLLYIKRIKNPPKMTVTFDHIKQAEKAE